MGAFSLNKMFGLGLLISISLYLLLPMIQEVSCAGGICSSTAANQLTGVLYNFTGQPTNSTFNTMTEGQLQKTFSLINSSATKSNTTAGTTAALYANVQTSIGLGFIYPTIGNFVLTLESFGTTMNAMLNALTAVMPAESSLIIFPFHLIIDLLSVYVSTRILILVISSWQKMDLWNT